jgi:hypothetical protein
MEEFQSMILGRPVCRFPGNLVFAKTLLLHHRKLFICNRLAGIRVNESIAKLVCH